MNMERHLVQVEANRKAGSLPDPCIRVQYTACVGLRFKQRPIRKVSEWLRVNMLVAEAMNKGSLGNPIAVVGLSLARALNTF